MLKRLTYPGLIGLALVGLAGCETSVHQTLAFSLRDRLRLMPGLAWLSPIIPIAEVSQHRQGVAYLEGRVEQQLPLINQGLYQLIDDSGEIWVMSAAPPPAVGESVTIRAAIHYESILIQEQEMGEHYAEELERLARDR
ncbi:MAG: hypothetical protein HC929_07245 [Leptolyngbyaceae cyanobacterium SM2_5_2]|nr:hypothetical protein [Leptolyngbyaceae cyanobacterium SM2_5_2]